MQIQFYFRAASCFISLSYNSLIGTVNLFSVLDSQHSSYEPDVVLLACNICRCMLVLVECGTSRFYFISLARSDRTSTAGRRRWKRTILERTVDKPRRGRQTGVQAGCMSDRSGGSSCSSGGGTTVEFDT